MALRFKLLMAAIGLVLLSPLALPAAADVGPRDKEQDEAFKATKQGRIVPLRVIESRIVPQMRGADYLGPELDTQANRYRLKFIRDGRVIWVDVDARTGEVLGQSGG